MIAPVFADPDFASRYQDVIAGAMAAQARIDGKRHTGLRVMASRASTKGKMRADSMPAKLLECMAADTLYSARELADALGVPRIKVGYALCAMAVRGQVEKVGRNSAGHNSYRRWP